MLKIGLTQEEIKQLLNIYNDHKEKGGWALKLKHQKDLQTLYEKLKLSFMGLNLSLSEKIYWLLHNLKDFYKCPTCGKNIRSFDGITKGYKKHCSCRCAQLDPKTNNSFIYNNCMKDPKFRKQREDEYEKLHGEGIRNPFQNPEVKEKIKQTNVKHFGCENPQQNKEIKEKSQQTCLNRYGVSDPRQLGIKNRSKGEIEMCEYIKSIYNKEIVENCRDALLPYVFEIDCYIPELKIGFEYDGDYWHSLPDMKKRDNAKNQCSKKLGIKLYHIKEFDWIKNKENEKRRIEKCLKKN